MSRYLSGRPRLLFAYLILFLFSGAAFCQQETTPQEPPPPVEAPQPPEENLVVAVWRFELLSLEGRSLTVGKAVTGLLMLFLGFWGARIGSRRVERLLQRTTMNTATASATKTLLFYALIIVTFMITMELIEIPLTVFTLLGGAVAIGVGFGSQNLINNFISGLILLAERPIRVGDLIQIGDIYGNITTLGARSTTLRTGSNVELIIPNSSFLEQNVINWTRNDDLIRTTVVVGLAYGSPTRKVERLLQEATTLVRTVLTDPKPIIIFADFGDNALAFEVHFWIKMKSIMDRKRAESELRYHIDELFAVNDLVIAFPQRDVHLDMDKPIDIRLLAKQEPPEEMP